MSESAKLDVLLKKLENEDVDEDVWDKDMKKHYQQDIKYRNEIVSLKSVIKTNTEKAKKIAVLLAKQEYYNSLYVLQSINKDVDIYSTLDKKIIRSYIEEIYIKHKKGLEIDQIKFLIDKVKVDIIQLFIAEGLIGRSKDEVEYAEQKVVTDNPNTALIYELLKDVFEGRSDESFYTGVVKSFCKKEVGPGIVSTTTRIVIPCYRIVRDGIFDPKIEFNEKSCREQDYIRLSIANTNFRGGSMSIFNDNPYKTITGFDISTVWINDCIQYLVNLPMSERLTVYSYTFHGDRIANMVLRDNNDDEIYGYVKNIQNTERYESGFFPIFFQIRQVVSENNYNIDIELKREILSPNLVKAHEKVKKLQKESQIPRQCLIDASRLYAKQLLDIINRAPPLPDDCTVYRGVKTLFFSTNAKKTFKNEGFLSTSFDPLSIGEFTTRGCCVKKLKIKKGTKALFMECITRTSEEYEILFPPNLEFNVVSNKMAPFIYMNEVSPVELCKNIDEKTSINLTVMEQV